MSSEINSSMKDDSQQYASNDSGLSCNSSVGLEIDQEFQCDDLTKSLFINSFGGNELIQDDDIYSYKSKMEIAGIFPNKLRSFNLAKSDSFNFRTSCSFRSIIQDVENLKLSEPFIQQRTLNSVTCKKDLITRQCVSNPPLRLIDETKIDYWDKGRPKRLPKKNAIEEYLSSTIKDYRGDKALNDIVTYIQGSSKTSKPKNKHIKTPPMSITVDDRQSPTLEVVLIEDSGVFMEPRSPILKEANQSPVDGDSGTHSSQFISPSNSDEDSWQCFQGEFQTVVSKRQKRGSSYTGNGLQLSQPESCSHTKSETPKKIFPNKIKKNGKIKTRSFNFSILHSREGFHRFLSNQYVLFVKQFNAVP